jgi:hypothetical protein
MYRCVPNELLLTAISILYVTCTRDASTEGGEVVFLVDYTNRDTCTHHELPVDYFYNKFVTSCCLCFSHELSDQLTYSMVQDII